MSVRLELRGVFYVAFLILSTRQVLPQQTSAKLRTTDVVNTTSGPIVGLRHEFADGNDVNAYLGIPYAAPPIGDKRFEKPQPVSPWTTTRECTTFSHNCWFIELAPKTWLPRPGMDEDCLKLNVFAPASNSGPDLLPVLFYIHGGAFAIGSAAELADQQLAAILPRQRVLVVTTNYRLGLMGFLAAPPGGPAGNQALWDLKLALEWVWRNAARFGGDPRRITVGGQSAGSILSELLAMSPHTQDKVHQLLMMSGTNYFEMAPRDRQLSYAQLKTAAESLGFRPNQTAAYDAELVRFVRGQPAARLALDVMWRLADGHSVVAMPTTDEPFLPDAVREMRRKMAVRSVLVGCTRFEGLSLAPGLAHFPKETLQQFLRNNNKSVELWKTLADAFLTADPQKQQEEYKVQVAEVASDLTFNNAIYTFAEDVSAMEDKTVFVYRFDYVHTDKKTSFLRAATHCDDLCHLFGVDMNQPYVTSEDDLVVTAAFSTLIANFVKNGDPNVGESVPNVPKWNAANSTLGTVQHMVIDHKHWRMESDLFDGRAKKWRKLLANGSGTAFAIPLALFVCLLWL